MRIWDLAPKRLCNRHLLGEHRELHAIWNILTKNKKGYSRHPETLRWKGKLKALYLRHKLLVAEMKKRDFCHQSDLEARLAEAGHIQDKYIDSPKRQKEILRRKNCNCKI